jgi:hypothetical protein
VFRLTPGDAWQGSFLRLMPRSPGEQTLHNAREEVGWSLQRLGVAGPNYVTEAYKGSDFQMG